MVSAWGIRPAILNSQRLAAEETAVILEFGEALPAASQL